MLYLSFPSRSDTSAESDRGVSARWRRHESLKIIFYQYAESDGTAHYEFRTRRRRFLSLGLTKLHTRSAPLSIMLPTRRRATTHASGERVNSVFVNFLPVSPSYPFSRLYSRSARIWNMSGARAARFNPLILEIDNNRYETDRRRNVLHSSVSLHIRFIDRSN